MTIQYWYYREKRVGVYWDRTMVQGMLTVHYIDRILYSDYSVHTDSFCLPVYLSVYLQSTILYPLSMIHDQFLCLLPMQIIIILTSRIAYSSKDCP